MPLMGLLFQNNLDFSMVVTMITVQACNFLSLNEDNNEFIYFLCSDNGQNMTNKSLSIHIEFGNIFYQNFNTNENLYSFLLAQQDNTKAIIGKRIMYHYSFEKYIKNYLPSFSVDDIEKFDLYPNKNSKYLFINLTTG